MKIILPLRKQLFTMGAIILLVIIAFACYLIFVKKGSDKGETQEPLSKDKPTHNTQKKDNRDVIPLVTPVNCSDNDEAVILWKRKEWDKLFELCLHRAIEEDKKLASNDFSKASKNVVLHNIWVWKRNCDAAMLMRDGEMLGKLVSDYDVKIMAPAVGICEKDGERYDFLAYYEHLKNNCRDTECWYPCVGCEDCSACVLSVVPKDYSDK